MNLQPTGLRKTTPGTIDAVQHARRYLREGTARIEKMAALRAAKEYAAARRLGSSKLALLDLLFKYTQPQDWTTPGVEPIVWPSNQELATGLGSAIGTMKHHLNGLAQEGLITFADGPTYHRRGYRDGTGRIVHAQGICLAVIAVRYDEFVETAEAFQFEQKRCGQLRNHRTTLRKEVESTLHGAIRDNLPGPWHHYRARLDVLREQKAINSDELGRVTKSLETLRDEAEDAVQMSIRDLNLDSPVSKIELYLTTSESQDTVFCNSASSPIRNLKLVTKAATEGSDLNNQPTSVIASEEGHRRMRSLDDLGHVSLSLIQAACPVLESLVPGSTSNWMKLASCGRQLTIAGHMTPQVWLEACQLVGENMAIAALAVTLQKSNLGTVKNPGAYMRRLIQLGRDQELLISRSLYALAGGAPSPAPANEAVVTDSFPLTGKISFGKWAIIVRENAPKPTPDVEIVADSFRGFMTLKSISPSQPDIKKTFISYCTNWRERRN